MKINVPTPHNEAKKGDIANIVIMPGDPLRAKYIAEKYLTDTVCYNKVRNVLGFTGMYNNIKISVQASGMGVASMGIYSRELYEGYDVDLIIRVGSAGALADDINLRDIIIAEKVTCDSNYLKLVGLGKNTIDASSKMLESVHELVKQNGIENVKFGKTFTSLLFYNDVNNLIEHAKDGYLAVEMETSALYANAKLANKEALGIFTVSDNPIKNIGLSSEDREKTFDDMIEIALKLAEKYEQERN